MAAFDFKVVSVLTPAAAGGTTVVTGVGFRPKAAIVFGVRTAGTQGLACAIRMGVDDGTTRFSKAINPGIFSGQHFADSWMSNGQSFLAMRTQGLNELMVRGHIQSFDPNGCTVKWDFILVATGVRFYILLLGGDSFSAKVVGLQPNASPYIKTGVGFQPTALFGIFLGDTFNDVLLPGGSNLTYGWSGDTTCGQMTAYCGAKSNFGGPSISASYQTVGEWLTVCDAVTGAIARRSILTSFDPDGFTITNTGGGTYGVLAMRGPTVNVGRLIQPTLTGGQNIPLVAGSPRVVCLGSFGKPASAAAVSDVCMSFGVGYLSEQSAVWTGELTGIPAGSESGNCAEDSTHLGLLHTPTGNFASTLNTRVSLAGMGTQSMDLTWDTVSGVANDWVYAVLAEDVGTGPCGGPTPIGCVPDTPDVPSDPVSPVSGGGSVTGDPGVVVT